MSSKVIKALAVPSALASLAMSLAACGTDSGNSASASGMDCSSIHLGYSGPLTGPSASYGATGLDGLTLAVEQYNKKNNCDIKIDKFDSQGDPAQAPALAQQAIKQKNLLAIVGPGFSGEVKATGAIYEAGGLPTVISSATSASLSDAGWKTFHRVVGSDAAGAAGEAQFLIDTVGVKKVAVVDNSQEYGRGIADGVRSAMKKASVPVVASESIDAAASDYSSTVTKIKAANPDAVYCGCLYAEGGRLLKQLRDGGVNAVFLDSSYDPGLISTAGAAAAEGAYVGEPATAPDQTNSDFRTAWEKRWGKEPGMFAAESYDAANAILKGIKAGNTTRQSLNDWLTKDADFKGISGQIKFGPDGNVKVGHVTIFKVVDGQFQTVKTLAVS